MTNGRTKRDGAPSGSRAHGGANVETINLAEMTADELTALATALADRKTALDAERATALALATENAERSLRGMISALAMTDGVSVSALADGRFIVSTERSEMASNRVQPRGERLPTTARPFVSERSGRVSYMTDDERSERARARAYAGRHGLPWNKTTWLAAHRAGQSMTASVAACV